MITGHAWRRYGSSTIPDGVDAEACAYFNCHRPESEHERANHRGDLVQAGRRAVAALEEQS